MYNGPWNPAYKPQLSSPIFTFFFDALASGVIEIDPKIRRALQELPVTDLDFLADWLMSRKAIKISVDNDVLFSALDECRKHCETRELFVAFLGRGASNSMIAKFFPVCETEAKNIRKEYGVSDICGRKKMPHFDVQWAIWHTWKKLGMPDMRKRYLALSDLFPNFSLSELDAILRELDKAASAGNDEDEEPCVAAVVSMELGEVLRRSTLGNMATALAAEVICNITPPEERMTPRSAAAPAAKTRSRAAVRPNGEHPWRELLYPHLVGANK